MSYLRRSAARHQGPRCCVCNRTDPGEIMRHGKCRVCWDESAFKCVECQRVLTPVNAAEIAESRATGRCAGCANNVAGATS